MTPDHIFGIIAADHQRHLREVAARSRQRRRSLWHRRMPTTRR